MNKDLTAYTVTELHNEIQRRAEAEEADNRRFLATLAQRGRLNGAVQTAKADLAHAETEHAKRATSHDALLALNLNVRPDEIRNAEIAVAQANRARTEAQDRLIAAERALDAFNSRIAA